MSRNTKLIITGTACTVAGWMAVYFGKSDPSLFAISLLAFALMEFEDKT